MRLKDRRCLASSLLLVAALLLYTAGAVLDPLVHLAVGGGAEPTLLAEGCRAADFEAPAPAEFEHDCVACKLTRAVAVPPSALTLTGGRTVAVRPPSAGSAGIRAPPAVASLRSRAPPRA